MAAGLPHAQQSLVVSVSFMEQDLLDSLLDDIEEDHEEANADCISPESPADAAFPAFPVSVPKPTLVVSVQAKRIRPELDPLPPAVTEARADYFTVNDYVWPTPTKRACHRMPDDERRQRHRESQREFMTRKRAQFRAMRAEIVHLEKQTQWLEARGTLKTLMQEHQSLQASLAKVVTSIESQVWKKKSQKQ